MSTSEDSSAVFNVLGSIMVALCFCSLTLNSCGLLMFFKNKTLRSPTNQFIIALTVCDFMMAVMAIIPTANCFFQHFFFSHGICVFEGFMVYFLGLTSIYLLAAISMDRYIIIAKPLHSSKITGRVALSAVLVCWFLGFVWSALPLAGWNRYTVEGLNVSCSVDWISDDVGDKSFIYVIFVFCFLLPLGVMAFCYFGVFMTIRHIRKNNPWDRNSRVAKKNKKLEMKMLKMCLAVVGVFIIAWTPYAIVSFMSAFGYHHLVTPLVATIPALIAKFSGLWNPIIYLSLNKQFCKAFAQMLSCACLRKAMLTLHSEEADKPAVSTSRLETASKTVVPSTTKGTRVQPMTSSVHAENTTSENRIYSIYIEPGHGSDSDSEDVSTHPMPSRSQVSILSTCEHVQAAANITS